MAKRLAKRIATTHKSKEVPEPETVVEKGAVSVAEKTEPMLGRCKECERLPVYTLTSNLCFECEMSRRGLEYDEESNRYIKPKRRK